MALRLERRRAMGWRNKYDKECERGEGQGIPYRLRRVMWVIFVVLVKKGLCWCMAAFCGHSCVEFAST